MTTFSIEVAYEGARYECFVQKLGQNPDTVYIVNFRDNCLIRQFNAKKAAFCQRQAAEADGYAGSDLHQHIWNTIRLKEAAGNNPVPAPGAVNH